MVWTCDKKRRELHKKEGDKDEGRGYESNDNLRGRWMERVKEDLREKKL